MTFSIRLMTTTAAVLAIGATLPFALPTTAAQAQNSAATQQRSAEIPLLDARKLVGRTVVDSNGQTAGRIASLVIDTNNGVIEYVIVNLNGNLTAASNNNGGNNAGNLVALPWSVLQQPTSAGALRVEVTAQQLLRAPRLTQPELARVTGDQWRRRIYGFWGVPYPYYGSAAWYGPYARGYGMARRGRYENNQSNNYNNGGNSNNNDNNVRASNANYNGGERALTVGGNGVISELAQQSTATPNSLQGTGVFARNGTPIGAIKAVMIDTASGHVAYVVVQRGGFLGLKAVWYPIPLTALAWTEGACGAGAYAAPGYSYGRRYGYAGGNQGAATTGAGDNQNNQANSDRGYAGGFYGGYYRNGYPAAYGAPYGGGCGLVLKAGENTLRNIPSVPISSFVRHNNGGGGNGNGGNIRISYVSRRDLAQLYRHFGASPYWQTAGNSGSTSGVDNGAGSLSNMQR